MMLLDLHRFISLFGVQILFQILFCPAFNETGYVTRYDEEASSTDTEDWMESLMDARRESKTTTCAKVPADSCWLWWNISR